MERKINNVDRPYDDKRKDDAEMMEAVLKDERKGWTRISSTSLQYCAETGYGFVVFVRKEWNWLADRNGCPRKEGKCSLLESAMSEVQNVVN
jgi:hypothetical protein